jgi:hypothetical protein
MNESLFASFSPEKEVLSYPVGLCAVGVWRNTLRFSALRVVF